jgi:hypothetical protein
MSSHGEILLSGLEKRILGARGACSSNGSLTRETVVLASVDAGS